MIELTANQCRVIGVMLEKEITTPDQYPLSLNGLTVGCNQKSNRDPVMSLTETEVQNIVDELIKLNQILVIRSGASRVDKFQHRFCNTQFSSFQFTPQQKAILTVLLLRGPQTPGELRTRTNRLAEFNDVTEVEDCLQHLSQFNNQGLVKKLPKQPGKREARYVHLFTCYDPNLFDAIKAEDADAMVSGSVHRDNSSLQSRVEALEAEVKRLNDLVERLSEVLE
ncbi:YceH family protein [Thalassotalea aquiviva]|uniref:YceH family protein n=1 Tax=Thalassotalea aquiviva TaxID=3242415 RepID=UPI00352A61CE